MRATLLVLAAAVCCSSTSTTGTKPVKITSPLGADEIAIYQAVLAQYAAKEAVGLNVSSETYPLDSDFLPNGLSDPECAKGIELADMQSASHSYHVLSADVLVGKSMRLVDPRKQTSVVRSNDPDRRIGKGQSVESAVKRAFETGLFSVSEIGFDKEHRIAVVSYRFWCGSLCGNGSTVVFEKVNGEWKDAKRNCGGWVS